MGKEGEKSRRKVFTSYRYIILRRGEISMEELTDIEKGIISDVEERLYMIGVDYFRSAKDIQVTILRRIEDLLKDLETM